MSNFMNDFTDPLDQFWVSQQNQPMARQAQPTSQAEYMRALHQKAAVEMDQYAAQQKCPPAPPEPNKVLLLLGDDE